MHWRIYFVSEIFRRAREGASSAHPILVGGKTLVESNP